MRVRRVPAPGSGRTLPLGDRGSPISLTPVTLQAEMASNRVEPPTSKWDGASGYPGPRRPFLLVENRTAGPRAGQPQAYRSGGDGCSGGGAGAGRASRKCGWRGAAPARDRPQSEPGGSRPPRSRLRGLPRWSPGAVLHLNSCPRARPVSSGGVVLLITGCRRRVRG